MTSKGLLHWIDGPGWLVLSAGDTPDSEIRALVLERAASTGGVAYITFAPDEGDALMDDMEDLGAPTGFLLDLQQDTPEALRKGLEAAAIVVIEGDADPEMMRERLDGPTGQLLKAAFARGVMVLVEGRAAELFGEWMIGDEGELVDGLGWLRGVLVVSGITSLSESRRARAVLLMQPDAIMIGIGAGSALALGPQGEVETWGQKQVTISLGSQYQV